MLQLDIGLFEHFIYILLIYIHNLPYDIYFSFIEVILQFIYAIFLVFCLEGDGFMQVDQAFTVLVFLELVACVNELYISQDFIVPIYELTFKSHNIMFVSLKENFHGIGILSSMDVSLHVI